MGDSLQVSKGFHSLAIIQGYRYPKLYQEILAASTLDPHGSTRRKVLVLYFPF